MPTYTVSWKVQARVDAPSCRDAAIAALKEYRYSPQGIPSVCVQEENGERHDIILSGFPYFLITDRENEVLRLLAMGYDNAAIAAELHLTERTVKNRLGRLMQKVGVRNRVQLVVAAAEADAGHRAQQRDMSRYRAALDALGPKRKSIAALVRNGLTNRDIAQALGNTEGTIKGYLTDIYDALGVSTRLELANWMVSLGLDADEASDLANGWQGIDVTAASLEEGRRTRGNFKALIRQAPPRSPAAPRPRPSDWRRDVRTILSADSCR